MSTLCGVVGDCWVRSTYEMNVSLCRITSPPYLINTTNIIFLFSLYYLFHCGQSSQTFFLSSSSSAALLLCILERYPHVILWKKLCYCTIFFVEKSTFRSFISSRIVYFDFWTMWFTDTILFYHNKLWIVADGLIVWKRVITFSVASLDFLSQ